MKNEISSLVVRSQNGDSEAFGRLYELFAPEMYRYSLVMVKDEETAKDCVNEAALEAYKSIKLLRDTSAFKGWLFRILNACCKRNFTSNLKNSDMLRIDDEGVHTEVSSTEVDTELSMDMQRALSTLDDIERQIVMLSVVYDYTSREIADIVNINSSTVRTKLKRALAKCKDYMERGGEM